jgi:heat shock protein HtpX
MAPRRSSSNDDDRKSGSGGAMIAILVGVAILAVSWGLSVVIRFAISRKREFIADAGSVELTKNPDAMISALRKIEAHAAIPDMPTRVSAFFIETPALGGETGWMSTHPSIEERVGALVRYAGGRDSGPIAIEAPPEAPAADEAAQAPVHGPWGDHPKA